MIGFAGGRPAGPRPGCSTASSRSTARCCPTESPATADVDGRRAGRGGQAGGAGRRAQHPGPAALRRRRVTLEAGGDDEAPGRGAARGAARRRAASRSRSTRATCSTGSARSTPTYAQLSFTDADQAGGDHRRGTDGDGRRRRLPLPAHAGAAVRLSRLRRAWAAGSSEALDGSTGEALGRWRMEIGLIGLGKMGGNMAERLRRGGHTVVGYDRNPDGPRRRHRSRSWSSALRTPAGGLGDGARPASRPGRPSRELGELLERRRRRHRRRQLPLHRRPGARRDARRARASATSTPASPAGSGA